MICEVSDEINKMKLEGYKLSPQLSNVVTLYTDFMKRNLISATQAQATRTAQSLVEENRQLLQERQNFSGERASLSNRRESLIAESSKTQGQLQILTNEKNELKQQLDKVIREFKEVSSHFATVKAELASEKTINAGLRSKVKEMEDKRGKEKDGKDTELTKLRISMNILIALVAKAKMVSAIFQSSKDDAPISSLKPMFKDLDDLLLPVNSSLFMPLLLPSSCVVDGDFKLEHLPPSKASSNSSDKGDSADELQKKGEKATLTSA